MANEKKEDRRSRNWVIVFYPESAPENYDEIIRGWRIKAFLSPLHAADQNADGAEKKPHFHLMLLFAGKKSVGQVQELSDQLSGVKVLEDFCVVRDTRAMARYLTHMDNPEKAQYSARDVVCYGGADYLEYVETVSDVTVMLNQITEFCIRSGCMSLATLNVYADRIRPDWSRVIHHHTVYIINMLKSIQWSYERTEEFSSIKIAGRVYTLSELLDLEELPGVGSDRPEDGDAAGEVVPDDQKN